MILHATAYYYMLLHTATHATAHGYLQLHSTAYYYLLLHIAAGCWLPRPSVAYDDLLLPTTDYH